MAKKRRQVYQPKTPSRIGLLWASQEAYDAAIAKLDQAEARAQARIERAEAATQARIEQAEALAMERITETESDYVPDL